MPHAPQRLPTFLWTEERSNGFSSWTLSTTAGTLSRRRGSSCTMCGQRMAHGRTNVATRRLPAGQASGRLVQGLAWTARRRLSRYRRTSRRRRSGCKPPKTALLSLRRPPRGPRRPAMAQQHGCALPAGKRPRWIRCLAASGHRAPRAAKLRAVRHWRTRWSPRGRLCLLTSSSWRASWRRSAPSWSRPRRRRAPSRRRSRVGSGRQTSSWLSSRPRAKQLSRWAASCQTASRSCSSSSGRQSGPWSGPPSCGSRRERMQQRLRSAPSWHRSTASAATWRRPLPMSASSGPLRGRRLRSRTVASPLLRALRLRGTSTCGC
mmetsp:Transcript_25789/g.72204  ORF Transcript_25789/g.72204 Transcript_25789/m.72204 type:complete len:320 (+) Transcript_25789:2406-3365(+)